MVSRKAEYNVEKKSASMTCTSYHLLKGMRIGYNELLILHVQWATHMRGHHSLTLFRKVPELLLEQGGVWVPSHMSCLLHMQ